MKNGDSISFMFKIKDIEKYKKFKENCVDLAGMEMHAIEFGDIFKLRDAYEDAINKAFYHYDGDEFMYNLQEELDEETEFYEV